MTKPINKPYASSFSMVLLAFIREHPDGIRRRDLADAFSSMRATTLDRSLSFLRKEKLIFNKRTEGVRDGVWFAVAQEDIPAPFPEIASDLINELQNVHTASQEMYLARRLHELFGDDT